MKFLYLFVTACVLCACSPETLTTLPDLIPHPNGVEQGRGSYRLPDRLTIAAADSSLLPATAFLQRSLPAGITAEAVQTDRGDVVLTLNAALDTVGAYRLGITRQGIRIEGGSYGGIIAGIATLRQLLPTDGSTRIPVLTIEDAPRFAWRGFMLDVARHFFTKEEVMALLDRMAQYKFNKFHWHLTDDQGWRIEIKRYPELAEQGGWREYEKHNNDMRCAELAAIGDDPAMRLPADRCIERDGKKLYGGYYTQEDIREVVAYAATLGIDVIPEIDMPGHSLKIIESHPELSCKGTASWGETFSVPLCLGNDAVVEMCRNIYAEVFDLFPFRYVHLGADEVEQSHWRRCPKCQQRIAREHLDGEHGLQSWFVRNMELYFNEHGRQLIGWDEITGDGLSRTALVEWWRAWRPDALDAALKNGNEVILCPGEYLYLDAAQNSKTLRKVYGYEPVTPDKQMYAGQMLAIHTNLWAETVPSFDRACYQIFPRFFAVSEVAWSQPSARDESSFLRRAAVHMQRLDAEGWNYRIPDLEGFCDNNVFTDTATVAVVKPFESITVRYTTDGSVPSLNSPVYTEPLRITSDCTLRLRSYTTAGKPGDTVSAEYRKSTLSPAQPTPQMLAAGLTARWYDYRGESCTEIESATHKDDYIVTTVAIPEGVSGNIGLIFEGYIDLPADGIYSFYTYSDDGSVLSIDSKSVVENDGPHSRLERTGQAALQKGLHQLTLRYFDSNGGVLEAGIIDADGTRRPFSAQMLKYGVM